MGKVGVITDSSVCLPESLLRLYGIVIVPLRFWLDGHSYRDGLDIEADDVYRMLPHLRSVPSTSAPTPSDYYAALEEVARTASEVVVFTIARQLSGAWESASAAAATARDMLPGLRITVVDSGTAAGAQGLVVLQAARAAGSGASGTEVVSSALSVMQTVELLAFLDTLYYIARSGRVPMVLHYTNTLLKVNPLFHVRPLSGEARTIRVARGRASAERLLIELVGRHIDGRPLRGLVLHSCCRDDAERLETRLRAEFDCAELHVGDFTPAMGVHAGPGVLGLAFHPT